MSGWTQQDAIELCRLVEAVCPKFGDYAANSDDSDPSGPGIVHVTADLNAQDIEF